ncbi:hypothetical protein F5X98DRAFT_368885 [Xylaria grammica]|nr:hypothetical protein F5X98DRAFT_368885 [Xylaria grammica]
MAMPSSSQTADLEFRSEVINKLLDSVDCAKNLKNSFRQFLLNITADANHTHLAYHLFCTVTLYISQRITLDEEQMSVLCRIIGQLRQEWGDSNAPSEHSTTSSYNEDIVVRPEKTVLPGSPNLPCTEVRGAIALAAEDAANNDIGYILETLEHANIARSGTPDNFVREVEKHVPAAFNFQRAANMDSTAGLESQYPFGYRLMAKQGWSGHSGLGPNGTGIRGPIDADTTACVFRIQDSPRGLGYTPKANSNAPLGGASTEKTEKQINEFAGARAAWPHHVADTRTGDKTARTVYRHDSSTTNLVQPTRLVQGAPIHTQVVSSTTTNNNTKTIIRDKYVTNDNWKDTSNYASTPHAQKNVSREIWGKTVKPPFVEAGDFVPCGGSSAEEGW